MGVFIIAEAGVNHNGDTSRALEMVNVACQAGANAIKFQTYRTEDLVTRSVRKAKYQMRATGADKNQFEMLKALELSDESHRAIANRCSESGIVFMSTAFDEGSLRYILETFDPPKLKIASGEITNGPLLLSHARSGKELILSTGMSTIEEIRAALKVLAYGSCSIDQAPTNSTLDAAFNSEAGREFLKSKVSLLHCTSEYPAPYSDLNLHAMSAMANEFGLQVGYSDHSKGIHVPLAAVALGARIIEKHFTLSRDLPGPDHQASLMPDELREMICRIREIECALGASVKKPSAAEMETLKIARKHLVAATPIEKGEVFSEANIAVKRSKQALSPMCYWDLLGRPASRRYEVDDPIELPVP